MHLTDSIGNPIRVSFFVIYNIINPVNNYLNKENDKVMENWIEGIVRNEISNYSYTDLTSGNKVTPTEKKNETKCSYDLYIL